jgi:hypothetical protein
LGRRPHKEHGKHLAHRQLDLDRGRQLYLVLKLSKMKISESMVKQPNKMELVFSQPFSVPKDGRLFFQITGEYDNVPKGFEYQVDVTRSYFLVQKRLGGLDDRYVNDNVDRVKLYHSEQSKRNGEFKTKIIWALIDAGEGRFICFESNQLSIYSYDLEWANAVGDAIYAEYHQEEDLKDAHFRIIGEKHMGYDSEEIVIRQPYAKTDGELNAHYPDGILNYRDELFSHLENTRSGIHILLGTPGTGKTSFIRYVIGQFSVRKGTKFYFVPPQYYAKLGSTKLIDFLREEHSGYEEETRLVLILEDSEALLRPRIGGEGDAFSVSELLNISDGLLGEGLDLQFICTINCPLKELDEAITRPGRLLSAQQFFPLSNAKALTLAKLLNRDIPTKQRGYTLAEIYHIKASSLTTKRKIGFDLSEEQT